MYLDYISEFTIDIFNLFFTMIWIIAFVYLASEAFKYFIIEVFELRKNQKSKIKNYETF